MASLTPLEVLDQVQNALEKETRYGVNRYPVQLVLKEGKLTLSGEFHDIRAKRHAVHLAKEVATGLEIIDMLNVTSAVHEEGTLKSEVARALTAEAAFSDVAVRLRSDGQVEVLQEGRGEAHIEFQVSGGAVQLCGQVGSLSHRRLAEVLCWWSLGCERVDNQLEVTPSEADNDDEVSDALRMAMEKDPLVHAEQISIEVHNGSVTLNGYVPSQEEKRLVELDAWYVPGVFEVVNEVQTPL